jgi:hemoglobin/transferrin/lactoferrin receptor protein
MSALEGEDRDSGAPLNSIAPLRAILGLGYSGEAWGVDASLTAAAARDDVERPRVDFEAPAYQLVDLIAWFAPRWAGGARLQLAALNLFDETYWNALNVPEGRLPLPAAYYTEPGRTFRITLSYQF